MSCCAFFISVYICVMQSANGIILQSLNQENVQLASNQIHKLKVLLLLLLLFLLLTVLDVCRIDHRVYYNGKTEDLSYFDESIKQSKKQQQQKNQCGLK